MDPHEVREEGGDDGLRRALRWLWPVAVGATLVLYAANLWLGDLNQDEGWYLYAAKLVGQGKLPYVDFATTQGPLLPFVYVLANPLVAAWGVAGGRLFTAMLGFLGVVGAAWLAWRLSPPGPARRLAAFLAFCFAGINVYQSYFTTMVKTYSLASLLVVVSFLVLASGVARAGAWRVFLAGVIAALAAATRSSAVAVIPAVMLVLWFAEFRAKRGARDEGRGDTAAPARAWLWFGLGAGLALLALFGPFYLKAPEGVRFALVEYHAGRITGGLGKALAYKGGFVSRVVQAYFVAIAFGLAALAWAWARRGYAEVSNQRSAVSGQQSEVGGQQSAVSGQPAPGKEPRAAPFQLFRRRRIRQSCLQQDGWRTASPPHLSASPQRGRVAEADPPVLPLAGRVADSFQLSPEPLLVSLWLAVLAVTALHASAPFPYDDYQAMIYPAFTAALAASLACRVRGASGTWLAVTVLVLTLAGAESSPAIQRWFVQDRDRIWWPMKEESPLRKLQTAAAEIRKLVPAGGELLTQDTYLAVEAGLTVPPGLELGPFCYFPDWPDAKAQACRVVNRAQMRQILETSTARAAAFSDYGLAIQAPTITPVPEEERQEFLRIVDGRYRAVREMPDFGQAYTTLRILELKMEAQ